MAVPAGDQRDHDFAKKFQLEIPDIFKNIDTSQSAYIEKDMFFKNSSFVDNCSHTEATEKVLNELTKKNSAEKKINYRLRDAIFSRQRYWGEPFPVYYENDIPKFFINAEPGTILVGRQRECCRKWKNQKEITVTGSHFIQEDSPHEIGEAINTWMDELA